MAEIWVSPIGSDTTGDGSYTNPYKHIYKAIQVANDDDEIICKSGTYNEENLQGDYPFLRAGLTIRSESGNYEDVVVYADGWNSRNHFWGIELNYSPSCGKVTIKNITIKVGEAGDNGKWILYHFRGGSSFDLIGVFFDGQNKQSTSWFRDGNPSNIYKSTFRNAICTGTTGYFIMNDATIDGCKDNIFENIQTSVMKNNPSNGDYNCFYNNTSLGGYSLNTNDITLEPQFTGTDTAELQNTSPCIDAGVTVAGYVETYYGSAPDIGCYEAILGPLVNTYLPSPVLNTQATLKGYADDNGSTIDEKGFVYDTVSHADPGNVAPSSSGYSNVINETGSFTTGEYSLIATGLTKGQIYYVRAYAHNADGYSYGDEIVFIGGQTEIDYTEYATDDDAQLNYIQGVSEGSYSVDGYTFKYKQKVKIDNTQNANALTDYQVKLVLDSTNFDFGKTQPDGRDIRFTDSDDTTLLNYWIQEWDSTNKTATILVKVSSIPASSFKNIYFYYGSNTAPSASSIADTATFYSDGSDLTGWTNNGASVDFVEGNPAPCFSTPGHDYAYRDMGITPNQVIEFDVKTTGATPLVDFFFLCNSSGAGQMFRIESRAGYSSGFASTYSWTSWGAPGGQTNVSADTWHHVKIVLDSTTAYGYIDGVSFGSYTFANNGSYGAINGDGGTGGYFDTIYNYQQAYPEPTVTLEHGLQCYSESTIKTQGDYSLKLVANTNALNNTLSKIITEPIDLSGLGQIKLDVRASRTGQNFKIILHNLNTDTSFEYIPNITTADTWQTDTWVISSIPDTQKDSIDKIVITIINADTDNTIYLDNIYAKQIPTSSFSLEWVISKLKSFSLEWWTKKTQSSLCNLSWSILRPQRRYNILTYPLNIKTLTVNTYTFIAPVTGTLDSLVINLDNSGASGSTTIKVYLNNDLKKELIITASNSPYNRVITLLNDNITVGDKIIVDITSVATNTGQLQLTINEKTFTERLEVIKKCNVFNNTEYEDEIFYGDAEEWRFYLNQPLNNLVKVYVRKDTLYKFLSSSLSYGDILTNYITVTPEDISDYEELVITAESSIDLKVKEVTIPLKFFGKRALYPDYIFSSFELPIYLSAIKLYYSWDNINWYSVDLDSNTVIISNLPNSKGTYTFYCKYFYDEKGLKVISDTHVITYNPDPIDVNIDNNILNWNDPIPPDRVEVYTDGELTEQIDVPCKIDGFDSYEFQSVKTDPKPEYSTIWVDAVNGDDNNDGTYNKPYKHLYKAIQKLNDIVQQNGTHIVLKPGIYNEESKNGEYSNGGYPQVNYDVIIESMTGNFEDVVVQVDFISSYSYAFSYAVNMTFKNITLDVKQDCVLIHAYDKHVILSNVFINGNGHQSDINTHIGGTIEAYKTTIRDTTPGAWSQFEAGSTQRFKDCIFADIDGKLCYFDATTKDYDYNCLYNISDYGTYTLQPHDITSDPQFISSETARIQSTSPCVDAGTTVPNYVEDYKENAPDIGVWEDGYFTFNATVDGVDDVTTNTALLKGIITSMGNYNQVKVWFEYGIDTSYGNTTEKIVKDSTGSFSINVTNLNYSTYYHYRVVISDLDEAIIKYSIDDVFKTNSINNSTITLSEGDFYEKGTKYHFSQQEFFIDDVPNFNSAMLFYTIGFNRDTKKLEIRKVSYNQVDLSFDELATANFIPIWKFTLNSYFPDSDNSEYSGVFEVLDAEKIFYPIQLPSLVGQTNTKYRVYDITGRYTDFDFNTAPFGEDYLYSLKVTNSNGDILKQGQITQETSFILTMEEL